MDSTSCIDESSSTSTTTSQDTVSTTTVMAPVPELLSSPEKLCRLGSGSSVVLDAEIGGIEAESRKLPSSQYKGVVPQPNGRWGAQIYEKHQRVWLGTFNEEEEAAKAYDIAAQRFRGRDAVINFKPSFVLDTEDVDVESAFLNTHSKAEIVDMLRKHTYYDELQQSKRNFGGRISKGGGGSGGGGCMGLTGWSRTTKAREHLFDKAVTPSDVGKLNRLVIPKQHAEKNFPLQIGITPKGLLLNFEDNEGKVWRFRYSYWNSSQSYVLTKGWSRFVKEKGLKAGDIVSFLRSTGDDKQLFIEWKPRNVISDSKVLEQPFHRTNPVQVQVKPVQMVRLFGVNIFEMPLPGNNFVDAAGRTSWSGKRMRDAELVLESCKRQNINTVGA